MLIRPRCHHCSTLFSAGGRVPVHSAVVTGTWCKRYRGGNCSPGSSRLYERFVGSKSKKNERRWPAATRSIAFAPNFQFFPFTFYLWVLNQSPKGQNNFPGIWHKNFGYLISVHAAHPRNWTLHFLTWMFISGLFVSEDHITYSVGLETHKR